MTVNDCQERAHSLKSLAFPVGREQNSDLPLPHSSLDDSITQRIVQICRTTRRPIWVIIEAYHGARQNPYHRTNKAKPRSKWAPLPGPRSGCLMDRPLRSRRGGRGQRSACWRRGAQLLRRPPARPTYALEEGARGRRYRGARGGRDICTGVHDRDGINTRLLPVQRTGDITGTAEFTIAPDSIVLVEGVYASALEKDDWYLTDYILTDQDRAKKRAMTAMLGRSIAARMTLANCRRMSTNPRIVAI